MFSVLIAASVAFLASSPISWATEKAGCACYPDGIASAYICDDPSLTSIPDCVPGDILTLNIRSPSIPLVTETIRRFSKITRLNIGYMDVNPKISKSFLSSHPNLEFFEVYRTNLDYIDKDWFSFTPKIKELVFSENKIPSLDSHVFSNLPGLENVHLHTNLLTSIPSNIFQKNSMNYLMLGDNPWRCDCDMSTYVQWMREYGLTSDNNAYCSYPLELEGVNIKDLPANNRC